MHIILADAELELLPEGFKNDEGVMLFLRRMEKETTILDNYLMSDSIREHSPNEINRAGFPHIAYAFVRLNEDTIANESSKIDYAIHTKHDIIIEKRDLTGIGPGYQNFVERVETILQGNPRREKLLDYIEGKGIMATTVVLHPKGKPGLVADDQTNYIIGGFPEGDFRSDLGSLRKFSIYDKEITVPAALELLHFRLIKL